MSLREHMRARWQALPERFRRDPRYANDVTIRGHLQEYQLGGCSLEEALFAVIDDMVEERDFFFAEFERRGWDTPLVANTGQDDLPTPVIVEESP